MAKPKRMSDILASSSEKDGDVTMATATPPYSSEGPTLPVIATATEPGTGTPKRKVNGHNSSTAPKKQGQPQASPTSDPALYKPWSLLPTEVFKLLESQARLRTTQNVVPVVFTRNQNVKSGINRLKTYLGAYRDPNSSIEMPDALKQEDVVIAVSAQGQGTTKLVSIVDMVRRIVAPSEKGTDAGAKVETCWMYTTLASVKTERRLNNPTEAELQAVHEAGEMQESEEEEAFEPMNMDGQENQTNEKSEGAERIQIRKVPVLTVWMTKKKIPAFKQAFGEQSFTVKVMEQDED
ncbi:Nn.00g063300.m01.CDS01 [Neocucurbitaria sp. VM-36]